MMAVDDQALRVLAAPISNVELTVVALIGYAAYEDGIVLSTQQMCIRDREYSSS